MLCSTWSNHAGNSCLHVQYSPEHHSLCEAHINHEDLPDRKEQQRKVISYSLKSQCQCQNYHYQLTSYITSLKNRPKKWDWAKHRTNLSMGYTIAMHQCKVFITVSFQELQKDVHVGLKLLIVERVGIIFGLWELLFQPTLANIIYVLWQ